MTLAAGTRLGPYEIVSPLGAGGMGEVYKARDTKLDRDVAVKILPERLADDSDALARFEREAKAVAALSHPNILGIFDFGRDGAVVFAAMELLEGENLRERLGSGALPPRKAIEFALQIAAGLAAAHEKGIVHRDLKPENVFITLDGRVKLLDFGLAKILPRESAASNAPTAALGTEPGVVMGTVGYMSPEQVRGRPADHRSDIFSFGAILYEMLSGRRAFHGDSAAETMAAIAKEEPADLSTTNPNLSLALDGVVRHCLEKNPGERFQSARDLAFALQSASGLSSRGSAPIPLARSRPRGWLTAVVVGAALAAGAFLLGSRIGQLRARPAVPRFRRLTFRRGNVLFARFTPDGQNVVYSAAWDDKPTEIFVTRIGQPESRPLGIPNADVLSVSPAGELAIKLKKQNLYGTSGEGTLARVSLEGGAPREILEGVQRAGWLPDGSHLFVVRSANGKDVIELPVGNKIYESIFGVFDPRISPKGDLVAFAEEVDGQSALSVVDVAGKKRVLTKGWINVADLAWAPSGREIWFDSEGRGSARAIQAVSLDGKVRAVASGVDLVLHDIAPDGRALVEREVSRTGMYFGRIGESAERDLSWFEGSSPADLSADGKLVAFTEDREGGGALGTAYLRGTDGSAPVKLGEGRVEAVSQDGKWVLLSTPSAQGKKLFRVSAGAGEPIPIPISGIMVGGAGFMPDGKRIVFGGLEPGHGTRAYVADLDGKSPFAFTPDNINGPGAASPDGKRLVLLGPNGRPTDYSLDGKSARELPATEKGDLPVQWSADGKSIYLRRSGELPAKVYRYDLATGKRTVWKEIVPADRAGVIFIDEFHMTPDGTAYTYSCARITSSDLYLVEGWK